MTEKAEVKFAVQDELLALKQALPSKRIKPTLEPRVLISTQQSPLKLYRESSRANFAAILGVLSTDSAFCDMLLVSGTEEQSCSRIIIAAACPALIPRIRELPVKGFLEVPEIPGAFLKSIVHFAYTGEILLGDENVVEIFQSSQRLGMEDLRKLCEQHVAQHITVNSVLSLLMASESTGASTLKKGCLDFVQSNAERVFKEQEERFMMLPKSALISILQLEFKMDEHIVFGMVRRWSKHQLKLHPEQNIREIFSGVTECIRFVSLKKKFLQSDVIPLGILSEDMLIEILFCKASDPSYLLDGTESSKSYPLSCEDKLWLKPRPFAWKTMADFSSEDAYAAYMKSVLKPGMMLQAVRTYENVNEGDRGEFVQFNSGIPPCQVRWQGYGSTYWLYWRDLIIVDH